MIEEICKRENLRRALQRVQAKRGSTGIDGMTVEELPAYLRQHWLLHRDELFHAAYRPKRSGVLRFENREPVSVNPVFRRYSTDLSSRRFLQVLAPSSTRHSPNIASLFDPGGRPTTQ